MVDHASDRNAFTPPAVAGDSLPKGEKRSEDTGDRVVCVFGDICVIRDVICVCYPELNLGRWANTT